MSQDYARFMSTFWTGETGRQIRACGIEAQLVAVYLITSGHANPTGLYRLPVPYIAHDTGIPSEGASKALESLSEVGFAHYDRGSEMVWVPSMARIQLGETLAPKDNRRAWLLKEVAKLRKTPFFNDFLAQYAEPFGLDVAPNASPLEAPSDPLRSQQQQQQPLQQQQQPHTPRATAAELTLVGVGSPRTKATPKPPTESQQVREVIAAFDAAWEAERGASLGLVPNAEYQRGLEVLAWATEKAPDAPLELVKRAAAAACRDDGFARLGSPWAAFAKAPGRHLAATPARTASKGVAAPLSHEEHRRIAEQTGGVVYEF